VDALVTPAWIERHGQTQPLAVGMAVANGDRIRTGDGARVYLKLAEGSTVKLGADATLSFFSRSLRPQRDFKGALDVLAGAFRFTTDALQRVRSRDVSEASQQMRLLLARPNLANVTFFEHEVGHRLRAQPPDGRGLRFRVTA
jgi:hypothetical protein